MQQFQHVANEGMTVAQALLAVLIPIGGLVSTLGTMFMKRHFSFLDRVGKRLDEGTKLDAEIALELRLGREQRLADARLIAELERELGKKIDDHRTSEMAARVGELAAVVERVQSGPGDDEEPERQERPPADKRVTTLTGGLAAPRAGAGERPRGRRSSGS